MANSAVVRLFVAELNEFEDFSGSGRNVELDLALRVSPCMSDAALCFFFSLSLFGLEGNLASLNSTADPAVSDFRFLLDFSKIRHKHSGKRQSQRVLTGVHTPIQQEATLKLLLIINFCIRNVTGSLFFLSHH